MIGAILAGHFSIIRLSKKILEAISFFCVFLRIRFHCIGGVLIDAHI